MSKGEANLMSMGLLGLSPANMTRTYSHMWVPYRLNKFIFLFITIIKYFAEISHHAFLLLFHFKVSAFYNLSFTTVLVRGSKYETQIGSHFISAVHIVYFSQALSEFSALSAWLRVFAKISCFSLLLYDALFAQFCTIYSYAKMQ